jgi:hypothetical protein
VRNKNKPMSTVRQQAVADRLDFVESCIVSVKFVLVEIVLIVCFSYT